VIIVIFTLIDLSIRCATYTILPAPCKFVEFFLTPNSVLGSVVKRWSHEQNPRPRGPGISRHCQFRGLWSGNDCQVVLHLLRL